MDKHLKARTPWHLWVVGIVSLAWTAFGANDYLQAQLGTTTLTGTTLASVTGCVRYAYSSFELRPRTAADIVVSPPPASPSPPDSSRRQRRPVTLGR